MSADSLQHKWAQIREDIRHQRIKTVNDDLETMKHEALRLMDELQDKFDDIAQHALQKIEQRRADRRNPIRRVIRHNRWLPVVAGLGLVAAVVMVARSR